MNFSGLLSQEIERKRQLASERKKSKGKMKKQKVKEAVEEVVDRVDNTRLSLDDVKQTTDTADDVKEDGGAVEGEESENRKARVTEDEKKEEKAEVQLKEGTDIIDEAEAVPKDKQAEIQLKHERYRLQLQKEQQTDATIMLDEIDRQFYEKLCTQTRKYIKQLIHLWDVGIQQNSDEAQAKILHETKRDVVKLLYKLRSEKLKEDMLISLATICYYLQHKDYNKATESYLKLSIGNVAWPIGVKSVGIHSRSADLKITGEDKQLVANIMIDDKTRRWITAIKRLIALVERTTG